MSDKRIEMPTGKPVDAAHSDEDALVENIYREGWGTVGPLDTTSHYNMEEHLHERHQPERVEEQAGGTIFVEQTTFVDKLSWRNAHWAEWIIRPKVAAIATLASLALVNGLANVDNIKSAVEDIGDEVAQVVYQIEEFFDPLPSKEQSSTQESQIIAVNSPTNNVSTISGQDLIQVNPSDISGFLSQITEAEANGAKLDAVHITGSASDEAGGSETIGKADNYNTALATNRATAAKDELQKQASEKNIALPDVSTDETEYVLSAEAQSQLETLAKAAGYESGIAAIDAQANGAVIDGALGTFIDENFVQHRDFVLTANLTKHESVSVPGTQTETPQYRPIPENPVRPYDPNFILFAIPPIRLVRRGTVQVAQTELVPYEAGPRRLTTMKVYPEGIETAEDEQGIERQYLTEDEPWQWVRKYQHLLRDDRIEHVLRADYPATDGTQKSLRVLFADHTPTTATIALFQDLLEDASLVQDGTLADKHSAIVVFPADNIGVSPDRPKRIGLGIDTQEDEHLLGFNMPLLKLVELHMPIHASEQLRDELWDVAHTFSHELHGHGSDIVDSRIPLLPADGAQTRFGRFAAGLTWRDTGTQVIGDLQSLNNPLRTLNFETESGDIIPETDANGLSVAAEEGDVRLINGRPTRYGNNQPEGYAEAAWSLVTNRPIPFTEAGIASNGGYRLAPNLEQVVQQNVGADATPYVLNYGERVPNVVFSQGTVQDDDVLHAVSNRAKARAVPHPDDMAEIITSVSD